MSASKDYYATLGVASDVDEDALKKAYRKKALQLHPDKNKEPDAEERFKEVAEAYEVLSDAAKRRQYDAQRAGGSAFAGFGSNGHSGMGGGGGPGLHRNFSFHPMDPFELFRSFFGDSDPFGSAFHAHAHAHAHAAAHADPFGSLFGFHHHGLHGVTATQAPAHSTTSSFLFGGSPFDDLIDGGPGVHTSSFTTPGGGGTVHITR